MTPDQNPPPRNDMSTIEKLIEWCADNSTPSHTAACDARAELAAMRDELERVNQQHEIDSEEIQESRAAVSSIALERTDLLQRVQALEADKKRLDWLEGDTMRLQNVFGIQLNEDARRKDVRACIDTALSQEQDTPRTG